MKKLYILLSFFAFTSLESRAVSLIFLLGTVSHEEPTVKKDQDNQQHHNDQKKPATGMTVISE